MKFIWAKVHHIIYHWIQIVVLYTVVVTLFLNLGCQLYNQPKYESCHPSWIQNGSRMDPECCFLPLTHHTDEVIRLPGIKWWGRKAIILCLGNDTLITYCRFWTDIFALSLWHWAKIPVQNPWQVVRASFLNTEHDSLNESITLLP